MRRRRTWSLLVGSLLAATLLARPGFGDPAPHQEPQAGSLPPEPTDGLVQPAPEVIAAWKEAGAEFGWVSQIDEATSGKPGGLLLWPPKEPVAGDVPAFRFKVVPTKKLDTLPRPAVPFGLSLFGNFVTDSALEELAGLEQLRTLNLWNAQVSDAGLKELAGLAQLQSLTIQAHKVTDAGLSELSGLSQLRWLNLSYTQTTDAGLKGLAGLTRLKSLRLASTRVTDTGLKELAGHAKLQWLNLRGTRVTDAGLKELVGLAQLQLLRLTHTDVTDAGVAELQAKLPQLWIIR